MPSTTPQSPAKSGNKSKPKPDAKTDQPRIISKQVFTDFAAI